MSTETKITLFNHATDFLSYPTDTVIFNQGESGYSMFVIKEGEVDIKVGEQVIQTHGPGEIFGEMALIDSSHRSARAVAKTDCQLVSIDEKRFMFLVTQTPFFALQVMQIMAKRLRNIMPKT